MDNITPESNLYTVAHVALITGLSDRTIRSHLASGILQGEKINGLWQFTPEQVEAFLRHPAVRPTIVTKNNTIVYDFLLDSKKTESMCCIIIDMPKDKAKEVAQFFCSAINKGGFSDLRFAFDCIDGMPRVILRGHTEQMLELVNRYYSR